MAAYDMQQADIVKRLARIEGQVRGVARMVEDGRYCVEILDQVAAITKALHQVSLGLMHDHLGHCVADAVKQGGPQAQAKLDEATAAIARLMRA
jgi:CsoR family transcriptional regulator, copper-sensing transcriptional repressor